VTLERRRLLLQSNMCTVAGKYIRKSGHVDFIARSPTSPPSFCSGKKKSH